MARKVPSSEPGMLYRPRRRLSPASATCDTTTVSPGRWQASSCRSHCTASTTVVGPFLGPTLMCFLEHTIIMQLRTCVDVT